MRRNTWAVFLGGLALVTSWVLAPSAAPPLYDGLVLSNEPYRFLEPPPGAVSTKQPDAATATIRVKAGVLEPAYVATGEQPPQAALSLGVGAVAVPAGVKDLTLRVAAVPPPGPAPAGMLLDGNVYELKAVAAGRDVPLRPGADVRVALRGTGLKGRPSLGAWQGTAWSFVPTLDTGSPSVYGGPVTAFGRVALFVPRAGPGKQASSGVGGRPLVLVLVAFLLVTAAGLVAVRRRGRERQS